MTITRDEIAHALCCPTGCLRPGQCMKDHPRNGSYRQDQITAVLALVEADPDRHEPAARVLDFWEPAQAPDPSRPRSFAWVENRTGDPTPQIVYDDPRVGCEEPKILKAHKLEPGDTRTIAQLAEAFPHG